MEFIINRERQLPAALNLQLQNRNPGQDRMDVRNARMAEQKQPPEMFYKKGVFKNVAKFTVKHLCWNLFFNEVTETST